MCVSVCACVLVHVIARVIASLGQEEKEGSALESRKYCLFYEAADSVTCSFFPGSVIY